MVCPSASLPLTVVLLPKLLHVPLPVVSPLCHLPLPLVSLEVVEEISLDVVETSLVSLDTQEEVLEAKPLEVL